MADGKTTGSQGRGIPFQSQGSLLVLRDEKEAELYHLCFPTLTHPTQKRDRLTLGPRASLDLARSLLAWVSAMSARSSASSSSCWALRYLARLVLACCS